MSGLMNHSLLEQFTEGVDFAIKALEQDPSVLIMAPHGGGIERGTSEIAHCIAGGKYSLYCFEGLRKKGNYRMHFPSTVFTEPTVEEMLVKAQKVIAIHGESTKQEKFTMVGGLDTVLKDRIEAYLENAGYVTRKPAHSITGLDPSNVCNRGITGSGVQLEISRGLRASQFEEETLESFCSCIRRAL